MKKRAEVKCRNTDFTEDQNGSDAEHHRDDVRAVTATSAGDHAEKKYADQRTVGVTENPDGDRNDR